MISQYYRPTPKNFADNINGSFDIKFHRLKARLFLFTNANAHYRSLRLVIWGFISGWFNLLSKSSRFGGTEVCIFRFVDEKSSKTTFHSVVSSCWAVLWYLWKYYDIDFVAVKFNLSSWTLNLISNIRKKIADLSDNNIIGCWSGGGALPEKLKSSVPQQRYKPSFLYWWGRPRH